MGGNFKFQVQDSFLEYFFFRFGHLKNESHFLKKSHLYQKLSCGLQTQITALFLLHLLSNPKLGLLTPKLANKLIFEHIDLF